MTQISRVKSLIGQPVIVQLKDGSRKGGILEFAGWNKFLGKLQITVNRQPIFMPDFKWQDVQLHPGWDNPKVAAIDIDKLFKK